MGSSVSGFRICEIDKGNLVVQGGSSLDFLGLRGLGLFNLAIAKKMIGKQHTFHESVFILSQMSDEDIVFLIAVVLHRYWFKKKGLVLYDEHGEVVVKKCPRWMEYVSFEDLPEEEWNQVILSRSAESRILLLEHLEG